MIKMNHPKVMGLFHINSNFPFKRLFVKLINLSFRYSEFIYGFLKVDYLNIINDFFIFFPLLLLLKIMDF